MLNLPFEYSELGLPVTHDLIRRASVSGVQDKVQLKRRRGGFDVVLSSGDYILKPIPRHTSAHLTADIPINEDLTMTIASRLFGIRTAEHDLARFKDGEIAYLTRRFDFRNGEKIRQEDFCQLSNRTEESAGANYKYESSYEELAELMRRYCRSAAVDNPKVFEIVLFNYVFSNADAHLKNFSLYESPQGDYVLTPAYDLLNTALHFPNDLTATGLDFFKDGHFTTRYEDLGFYSSADFIELARCFGVPESRVRGLISGYAARQASVESLVANSPLSNEAKADYLRRFRDRLRAIAQ